MGETGQCRTQADQEHEGQHQVAAGGVAGARGHRASPYHAAAVVVENLGWGGGREKPSGASKGKQLAQAPEGPRRPQKAPRAQSQLGWSWLEAGISDPCSQARPWTRMVHTHMG